MKENPNYYAIIPADVRYDNNLKDKAKLLYGEITALSNQYGCCYANNKYFANLYKVSTTTISTLIKNLIDCGYIESEYTYKDGTKEIDKRYLKIFKGGYLKNFKGGYLKNFKGGIKENLKDNNTSINNININNKEIYKESCKRVINRLNELNNTKYSATTESTLKSIKARLEDGYTEEDLIMVVEKMSYLWNQPDKKDMKQYLRPSTLFRPTNFENYLNMPIKESKHTTKDMKLDLSVLNK